MTSLPQRFAPGHDREKAVLRAFRTAWAEYATSPSHEIEDAGYTWQTSTSTAHHELSQAFPEAVARPLAKALARAARAHFVQEGDPERE